MPSESIWFEQVDTAFIERIKSVVKLRNSKGDLVSVPATIRKPDEDFKIEQYPCITLYANYSRRDPARVTCDFTHYVRKEVNGKTFYREEYSPIPFNIYYQLDFWSKSQVQMNEMTRLWVGSTPLFSFNLPVLDVSGNQRNINVMQRDNLRKYDTLSGEKRLFRSLMNYIVWTYIDEKSLVVDDITPVKEIIVNTKK